MKNDSRTERGLDRTPVRPDRVRCVHCGMPVRGTLADCWSCGLPAQDASAVPVENTAPPPPPPPEREAARWAVIGIGACIAIVVVLGLVALLVPQDRGSTLRRFADKARGDDWHRLATDSFSIDLPSEPVEAPWPPGQSHPKPGQTWRASASGVHATVNVAPIGDPTAPVDGRAEARRLLEGLAAEQRGKASEIQAVTVLGAIGLDATITSGDGKRSKARAVVIAGVAHVFVVQGPKSDFSRLTESFRLAAT